MPIRSAIIRPYSIVNSHASLYNSSVFKGNVLDAEFLQISHDCNLFKAENTFLANYINLCIHTEDIKMR